MRRLSGLRGNEGASLERLLQAEGPQTPQRDAAVTMLAATVVRGGQDAAIQTLFGWVADDGRVAWQRAALLRGAEVAVLGAPMPGGLSGRRGGPPLAQAPCPTCPGARGGPGGAYAFPQAPPPPPVRRVVRLSREPATLRRTGGTSRMTRPAGGGDQARVEWPGKPGAAAPIAPLTAEQQSSFQCRAGGLQEHLPGLSSARRQGTGEARAQPCWIGARAGTGRSAGSHPPQRQGRGGRA